MKIAGPKTTRACYAGYRENPASCRAAACVCLCLISLVNLGRLPEIVPFLAPFHVGKVVLLAGAVTAVVCNPRGFANFFTATPMGRYLAALGMLACIGIPFSVWKGGAFESWLTLLKALTIAGVLFCLAEGRERALRTALLAAVLLLALLMVLDTGAGRLQVSATHDPNDIALLFVVFLPLLVTEGVSGDRALSFAAWAAAACAVIGIALSGSRGGILALAAVGGHAVLCSRKHRLPMLLLFAFALVLIGVYADDALWARFAELGNESDYNFTAESGRLTMWKHGLSLMEQNPVLGVGIGQFASGVGMVLGGHYLTAHNSFIQIGTELGLPGLAVFLGLLFSVYRLSVRGQNAGFLPPVERRRFCALRVSLTGYCVGGFFLSQAYGMILFALLTLAAVMHLQLARAEREGSLAPATGAKGAREDALPAPQDGMSGKMESVLSRANATRGRREALLRAGDLKRSGGRQP